MRKALWGIVALAGLLSACQPQPECYGRYQVVPRKGWALGDTLRFCVPVPQGEGPYRLDLCMRTAPHFPKTGVMLMVRTEQRGANGNAENLTDTVPTTRRVAFALGDSLNHRTGRGVALLQYRRPFLQLSLSGGDTLVVDVWPDLAPGDTLEDLHDVGVMLSH